MRYDGVLLRPASEASIFWTPTQSESLCMTHIDGVQLSTTPYIWPDEAQICKYTTSRPRAIAERAWFRSGQEKSFLGLRAIRCKYKVLLE